MENSTKKLDINAIVQEVHECINEKDINTWREKDTKKEKEGNNTNKE